jgi:prepilin-type N-terminal cleavage/methylation domain-containing protein
MKQNFKKGFTLIELLVVIAIIGILAAITVVSVQGPRNKATDTQSLANLRQVASVLEQSYGDTSSYLTAADWAALVTALTANPYGATVPAAPAGVTYNGISAAAGYCLWTPIKAGTADHYVRCKTGATCGVDVTISGAPSVANCG